MSNLRPGSRNVEFGLVGSLQTDGGGSNPTPPSDGLPLANTNRTNISRYVMWSQEMVNQWRSFWNNPSNFDYNMNGLNNIMTDEKNRIQSWATFMTNPTNSRFNDLSGFLDSNGQILQNFGGASVSGRYNMSSTRYLVAYTYEAWMTNNWANLAVAFDECFAQASERIFQMWSDQENTPLLNSLIQAVNPNYYQLSANTFGTNPNTGFKYWVQERYVSDGQMIGSSDKLCLFAYIILMAQDAIGQLNNGSPYISDKPHPEDSNTILDAQAQLDFMKEVFLRNSMFLARESDYNEDRYVTNSNTERNILNNNNIDPTAYNISGSLYPGPVYSHKTNDNVLRKVTTFHRFFQNNLNASILSPVGIAAWWFNVPYFKRLCKLYAREWLMYGVDEEFNPSELRRSIRNSYQVNYTGFYYTSRTIGQITFFGFLEALHDRTTDILDTSETYGLRYVDDNTVEYVDDPNNERTYLKVVQKLVEYIDGTKDYHMSNQPNIVPGDTEIQWIDTQRSPSTTGYVLQDAGQYIMFNYYHQDPLVEQMITRANSTPWDAYRYDIGISASYGTAGANPDQRTYRMGPKEMYMPFMEFQTLRNFVDIFEPNNNQNPPSDGLPLLNTNRTNIQNNLFHSDEMLAQFIDFWNNTSTYDYSVNGQTNMMADEKARIIDWASDFGDSLSTYISQATFDNHSDANAGNNYQIPSSLSTSTNVIGLYENGQQRVMWAKAYKARMESDWATLGLVFDWCYDQCNRSIFQMRSDQEGISGNSLDLARQEIMGSDYNFNDGFGLNGINGLPWWDQEEYRTEQNMISMGVKNYSLLYCAMLAKDGIGLNGFNVTNADFKLKFIKETCFRNAYFLAREIEEAIVRYIPQRNILNGEVDNSLYTPSNATYISEWSHKTPDNVQRKRIFLYQAWIANIGCTMLGSVALCAYMTTNHDDYLKRSYKQYVKDFLVCVTTSDYDYSELRRAQTGRNPWTGFYYHSVTMLTINYMIILEAMHERTTELRDYAPTEGLIYTSDTSYTWGTRPAIDYETMHEKHIEYFDGTKVYYEFNGSINSNSLLGLFDPAFPNTSQSNFLQDCCYFTYADYIWDNPLIKATYERTGVVWSNFDHGRPNPTSYGTAGDNPRGDRQTYRMGANETGAPFLNYARLKNYIDLFETS